jgi:hypothetical protein
MNLLAARSVETETGESAARHSDARVQTLCRTGSIASRHHLGFVMGWELAEAAVTDAPVGPDDEMSARTV